MPFNIEHAIRALNILAITEPALDLVIEELKVANVQVSQLQHDYDTLLQKVYADQKPIASLLRAKEKS
jgi:hypothetical protein